MDLAAWWSDFATYWASTSGQALLKDVLIPALAIVVSTLIAVIVLAAQLAASRRQQRSQLIAGVIERLAEVKVEAEKRHLKQPHELARSVEFFDASISALRFALPKRQQVVADVTRALLYRSYYAQDTFTARADAGKAATYFEAWVIGDIATREFRLISKWVGGGGSRQTLIDEWGRILETNMISYRNEATPAQLAAFKRSRAYRLMKRKATYRRRWRDVFAQWWWELRHPEKAEDYREARRAMKASQDR